MSPARVKLQRLPNGKYLMIVVNPRGFPSGGDEELSEQETRSRLQNDGATRTEIESLFAQAEDIAPTEATVLEEVQEEE